MPEIATLSSRGPEERDQELLPPHLTTAAQEESGSAPRLPLPLRDDVQEEASPELQAPCSPILESKVEPPVVAAHSAPENLQLVAMCSQRKRGDPPQRSGGLVVTKTPTAIGSAANLQP